MKKLLCKKNYRNYFGSKLYEGKYYEYRMEKYTVIIIDGKTELTFYNYFPSRAYIWDYFYTEEEALNFSGSGI